MRQHDARDPTPLLRGLPHPLDVRRVRGARSITHAGVPISHVFVPERVIGPALGARTNVTPSGMCSVTSATRPVCAICRFWRVSYAHRRQGLGRADRVLPGIWRLRLPLPWPGVPHVNAWALQAGDGIVLVDTGYHEEDSLREFERALALIDRRLEDVSLVVCTHAHSDHYGLAAPIVERAGCELWMHPATST